MSEKRKILLFTDWYFPGFKAGGPIRSIKNLVDNLDQEFDINIVTGSRDYHTDNVYEGVNFNAWNSQNNSNVFYIKENYFFTLIEILKGSKFDVIYLNSMFSLKFTILPLFLITLLNLKSKIILAPRGMLAKGALSIKPFKKKVFISLLSLFRLMKNVHFHSTSEEETKDIYSAFRKDSFFAPNFPGKIRIKKKLTHKISGSIKLISVARISPEKNLLFALKLLHQLKGNIEFNIYGSVNDQLYYNLCLKEVETLPANIRVNFWGPVHPDKLEMMMAENHFLFMPTLGENYGHIIIESLAFGCPVIISNKTPWLNLENRNIGWDVSLEDIAKFRSILEKCIMMDQNKYDSMVLNAQNFAIEVQHNSDVLASNKKLFL